MTLEERIAVVREYYPDPMTQLQFGEAVGLGKSTIGKLVRAGLVPYENFYECGKHYHMFSRADVIRFLKERYVHAAEDYVNAGKRCIALMLWNEPEILTVQDLMRITGLRKSAVQKWLYGGKLKGYRYVNGIITRKSDLINFLASPEYQDSSHKNIRAEAISLSVEWYQKATAKYSEKGGDDLWQQDHMTKG